MTSHELINSPGKSDARVRLPSKATEQWTSSEVAEGPSTSFLVRAAYFRLPLTPDTLPTVDQSLQAKQMAANFAKLPSLIKARLIKPSCWSWATLSCDPRRIF